MRSSLSAALCAAALGVFVYLDDGVMAFRPFLNAEALLLMLIGTGLFLWSAYPARRVFAALREGFFGGSPADPESAGLSAGILEYAAGGAVKVSVLGTLFALVLVLSSMDKFDAGILTRRLALVLDIPLFGCFLSVMVFTPMARRLSSRAVKR